MPESSSLRKSNERSRILGMQLEVARLQMLVAKSIQSHRHSDKSLAAMARQVVYDGHIARHHAAQAQQLQQLLSMRDRLASSLGASGKGGAAQVLGGKTRPRSFAVAAHEQVAGWCEQAEMTVKLLLELGELRDDENSFLGYLNSQQEEENSSYFSRMFQLGGPPLAPPPPFAWPHPVAHAVGRIPGEMAGVITLPSAAYPPEGSRAPGEVHWEASPFITDPASRRRMPLARHTTLEQVSGHSSQVPFCLFQASNCRGKSNCLV